MSVIRLRITEHAKVKMASEAINAGMVKEAIKNGTQFRQGKDKVKALYRYFTVIYKKIDKHTYKVITVYINR